MIKTVNELLTAIADALDNEDRNKLDDLQEFVVEWLVTDDEREAQLRMIHAAQKAVETQAILRAM